MNNVLLIEDSVDAFHLVHRALGVGVHIEWVNSQREATLALQRKPFDLILLDVGLPDGDGFQLCSVLQTHEQLRSVPVIFMTARNTVADRVLGFSVGADDFVSKPFDAMELKARVEAKLRKREQKSQASDVLIYHDLEIRKSAQRVFIIEQGLSRELDLTLLEFKLLLLLATKPNVVFSREELLDTAWGVNVHVYSRSVDTHISKLRKKLGSKSGYVESVHGSGYRFVGEGDKDVKTIELATPDSRFSRSG